MAAEVTALLSFPQAALRVLELLDDSDSTTKQVGAALATDPALAARVLRMANSSFYSPTARVETVERAVATIGRQQLRDLTVGLTAVHAFDGIPSDVVSMSDFWSHSIYCAILADLVARRAGSRAASTAFTAGLLHDVGQLVVFTRRPAQSREALTIAAQSGEETSMAQAERQLLGFDHTDVGRELVTAWRLPESLVECVAYHHSPSAAVAHAELVNVIHVANGLAVLAETEQTELTDAPIEPEALVRLDLVLSDLGEVLPAARERFAAVQSSLET